MMTLYVIGFIVAFLLVLASGFPVGFGLGFLGLGLMVFYTGFDQALTMGIERAYTALDSSVLVAVPLFIFTAQLIAETGMGKRLFDAARTFLGRFRSGLGTATIASSGIFAAMTGSSFVSASTMGLIAIPELRKAKFSDTLISSAITAGGSLGMVIPPSIVMIVYGYLTDESIGKLFMAGMIPGVLLIVLYSAALALCFRLERRGRPAPPVTLPGQDGEEQAPAAAANGGAVNSPFGQLKEAAEFVPMTKFKAFKEAFWGLLAPIIILGGIYLGVFTAPEAAGIAAIYCMLIGFFIYRTLTIRKFWNALMSSAMISAMVAVIIIGGAIIGMVVVYGRIPQQILALIVAKDLSPLLLLLLINLFLFFLGMFLEVLALVYLAIPLLYPVVLHMGWDNIWFAVILLINANLALITPPMGGVLYIVSQIGAIPINKVIKGALLPVIIMVVLLIVIIFVPSIATWLPGMM
ncbi:TRAP transporter large permease [Desulfatitalea alkaliphila]|uniref:TRAP transporter large permease n=1 Tax=Desulfatitalea alkaliphila TaxID=2929485 RepID=A0AA41UHN6_9BACT|nr:TRAP transporter large permease [Desulfatitalea alkaliphila]MCJ8499214.1 TRAP transporter large permease [Desulfatitalea alkaliphila]